jgi:hypothetical protein
MGIKMNGTSPDPAIDSTFQRADRDPNITRPITTHDPEQEADDPGIPLSGSTTLGEVEVYDIPTVDHEPGDQGAESPPHSGSTTWVPDRDRYANEGAVGQEYLNNPPS